MAIELFEHNREAYERVVAMLAETGKAAVIHPTGTGKSFIGFKLCEDNPDKKVLWLAPSEYIFDTQIENLKKAANGYTPENIEFCTYARLMNMTDEEIAAIEPDITIYDEYHRAGAACWSTGVERLENIYPDMQMLGLSATNIRYLDNRRDMAKELFDNNIASTLTLGEAIVRGILNPPKYVLSIFSYQKDLEKYEYRAKHAKSKAVRDKAQKYLEALRRKLENADGLDVIFDKHMTDRHGKYIVFTPDYEAMQAYMGLVDSWFWRVDREPNVYSVYSDDPAASAEFDEFKADNSDHLRLLFCIDALNEGIHVDDISGVILMRPTISPIIYKQQIGRALSASKSKEPVIFDIVNNIENLYSIDDIQEEMAAAISYYRSLGKDTYIVNETFKLIDKVADCKSLFDNLEETLTASWDLMYEKAVEFYETMGHNLDVPTKYITPDGYSLGTWIQVQRRVFNGQSDGLLTPERVAKLDKLGMRWDSMATVAWNRYYQACVEYKEKYGDLSPARTFITNNGIHLGSWIANLRTCRRSGIKNGFLTDERVAALDELGMVWEVHDFVFEKFYYSAVRYVEEHGDLNVPSRYVDPDGNRLGAWIDKNRKYYHEKNPNLTAEEIERLNSIGMMWEKRVDRIWQVQYEELVKYKKRFGNVKVPINYVTETGIKLGSWLSNQFEKYRLGKMSKEREEKLLELGVVFEKEDPWEERFKLAEEYYKEHHTLTMPGVYKVNGICLSKWVNEQKQIILGKRKGKSLTAEQIKRLESIGFTTKKQSEILWEQKYSEVKDNYTKNGRAVVPEKTKSKYGGDLHIWLSQQLLSYRKGIMRSDRAEKFKCLGAFD